MLAADPVIAEFQADNKTTIVDEDGDWSDWIEIRNPDTQATSLEGWYLTDNALDLKKWKFPAVTVGAGEELLVFASGKNRKTVGSPLHTNFGLAAAGEYLALVRPDGTTVVQAYDPFPAQFPDQSYGLAAGREFSQLIAADAPLAALVPTDDTLGLDWTQAAFNDATWTQGSLGAGFEVLQDGVAVRDDFDAPLGPDWSVDLPAESASNVRVLTGALQLAVPSGEDLGYAERGQAPMVIHSLPGDGPADWEIVAEVTQSKSDRGAAGIAVVDAATGTPAIRLEYNGGTSFRMVAGDDLAGSRTNIGREHYFLRLVRDGFDSSWSAYFKTEAIDDWTLIETVSDFGDVPIVDQPLPAVYGRSPSSAITARFEAVDIIVPDQRPVYGPSINTDLQTQMLDENSSVYLRMPFDIVGDPSRFDELLFATQFDDGFRAFLNGTPVASYNVPIESTWNSSAAGSYGAVNGRIPTRQFQLDDFRNLLQEGTNVLAVQGMNVSSVNPDFFFQGTLTGAVHLDGVAQYFTTPTPGTANQSPAAPVPTIVGTQGVFFDRTTIAMTLDEPNPQYVIRYTLDGSVPDTDSILYNGPFELSETAMLQARVFDTAVNSTIEPSPVVSATFIAVSSDLQNRTSDIPLIILDSLGQRLPGSSSTTLVPVNVVAFEVSKATGRAELSGGIVDYIGRGGVRDRGSSTGGQQKPNMAFETWGESGTGDDDDVDVPMLGFAAESDWVMHAPFTWDRAMVRNQLAYDMANSIGRWAPGTRAVEVYFNNRDGVVTEDDYYGVYVFMDKIKLGKDRVDITQVSPEDQQEPEISGGYIWKIDRSDPGEPTIPVGGILGDGRLNWVEPKSPVSSTAPVSQRATLEQQAWVIDYFQKFEAAANTTDISDPNGYSQYIDVGSWVDHNLISVLGDNVDALNLSTYLFKDRGGKIEYGPQWDFDRSMESDDDRDNDPTRWGGSGGTQFFTSNYWSLVFDDPGFWQAYVDRWGELRRGPLSDAALDAMLDKAADEIRESQPRNLERWTQSRPRGSSPYNSGKLDGTWEGEIEHLRAWLHERAHFMDGNFAQPPRLVQNGVDLPVGGADVVNGTKIKFEGPRKIFVDDYEFVSSEIGASSASYFAPSDDSLGTDWAQPSFNDSSWDSGPLGIGFDPSADFVVTEARPATDGTTLLVRVPFTADQTQNIDRLLLRVRYDDAYVAYLNGTEVTRRNVADGELTWNMSTSTRSESAGAEFEEVDITEFASLLKPGENVLALRVINANKSSNDMFIQPALVKRTLTDGVVEAGFYYYTLDGTDPRGPDGYPTASARYAPRGSEITVHGNTRVVVRNFDNVTDRGSESNIVLTDWSAPAVYNLVTQSPSLVISELNYNPGEVTPAESLAGFDREDFEFVEIYNPVFTTADLNGIQLADGVEFDFLGSHVTTLAQGQYLVVVANQEAFRFRYGEGATIAGEFTGSLNNAGEDIDLVDGLGRVLFSVNYADNDRWGVAADGVGATLELTDVRVGREGQNKWYNWRTSVHPGGTPGAARIAPPGVVINEVLARTEQPLTSKDAIELLNTTGQELNIGGWYLSDDANDLAKFPIPVGTKLGPGQYLVFDEDDFNADTPPAGGRSFALNGQQGESVWLAELDAAGHVVRFIDDVQFGSAHNGESLGRLPNGQGRLAPLAVNTLGSANTTPRVGPLVISELMYNPTVSAAALSQDPNVDESDMEFVEIHNPTLSSVDLTDWRLRGGVSYDFSAGMTLAPGAVMVVLKFDPADPENINQVNAFRAQYGIDEQVVLVGGYAGQLNNSDDRVLLLQPEQIQATPRELIYIPADEVLFDDLAPWPLGADGKGGSLQRRSPAELGNSAASWFSGLGSPGVVLVSVPGDFDGDSVVQANDIDLLNAQIRSGVYNSTYDLNGDGLLGDLDRDVLIHSVLGTEYGDANLDGRFSSEDLILVLSTAEYEDDIAGNSGWAEGDWDGDGDFKTSDLIHALSFGGYTVASMAALESTAQPLAARLSEQAAAVDAVWDRDEGVEQKQADAALAVADLSADSPVPAAAWEEELLESLFETSDEWQGADGETAANSEIAIGDENTELDL